MDPDIHTWKRGLFDGVLDGKQLATASLDNTVRLWELSNGEAVGTLKGHGDGVCFVG